MFRLPASLEKRLQALFPNDRERERFVVDTLEEALSREVPASLLPDAIGGTLHLFTDGGSRGNPGQAAIGYVLIDPTKGITLKEHGEYIGMETNNIAEYRALIAGLRAALRYRPNRLICHLDSELIVKQLNGEYRVKMPMLQALVEEIRELTMELPDVVFEHIPRVDNWRADQLVNRALDEHPTPPLHWKGKE